MKTKEEIEEYLFLIYGHGYNDSDDWERGHVDGLLWALGKWNGGTGTND